MDAFYASVEQRDRPELRGRPVAVGGSAGRGVVAAASYEARPFGVRSAMPSARAKRLCPDLVFVKPRFEVYRQVSREIRQVFGRYTDVFEPLSLDEAYLDITEPKVECATAVAAAQAIKNDILRATGLTASAGISFNKFLAKMASDTGKPNGLFEIRREDADAFLSRLPIDEFHGVGRATARKMKELGIYTGADLKSRSLDELVQRFGKRGRFYHRIVRGEDHRPVRPERIRKSVGAERTFSKDLRHLVDMEERLVEIAQRVAERLGRAGAVGRTVTLKIKFADFSVTTRSTTLQTDVYESSDLRVIARRLLHQDPPKRPVRLLGLTVSNLHGVGGSSGSRQLTLSLD